MDKKKIVLNSIRCNHCGDVIVSRSRNNYVTCGCGKCSVDGGNEYLRRCAASPDDYTELSRCGDESTVKAVHFYEYEPAVPVLHTWKSTQEQIHRGVDVVRTTQMGLLHTELFRLGYRIFIHESENVSYEILRGSGNERTYREIRMGQNLFKMWQAGEFNGMS